MRLLTRWLTGFALVAVPLAACDDVDSGLLEDDPGPPVLAKILIQDELPSGGRRAATDLLDKMVPRSCSDRDPCPSGDRYSHPPCDVDTGKCPDPLSPLETPPAIGAIVAGLTGGGNQIRLVFSKRLDPAISVAKIENGLVKSYSLADPTIIGLYDENGQEVPAAVKYWDPLGSPALTSDVFINPYGPALVIKPKPPFHMFTKYSIRLKPDLIRDAKGQAVQKDVNGEAVKDTYEFVTEGFRIAGGQLIEDPFFGNIDPRDLLAVKTNVRFDASTLKVTVTTKDGQPVEITAGPAIAPDTGTGKCFASPDSPQQINIFRVNGDDRQLWAEGDYLVTVEVLASDLPTAVFSRDGFGKVPFKNVPFTVKANTDKDELYLAADVPMPSECQGPPPTDLAMPLPDLSMPPADLGVSD